jgi:hypothetical protein
MYRTASVGWMSQSVFIPEVDGNLIAAQNLASPMAYASSALRRLKTALTSRTAIAPSVAAAPMGEVAHLDMAATNNPSVPTESANSNDYARVA